MLIINISAVWSPSLVMSCDGGLRRLYPFPVPPEGISTQVSTQGGDVGVASVGANLT